MATSNSFAQAFNSLAKKVDKATARSLNKSATATKKEYSKLMVEAGFPSARSKARARIEKAKANYKAVSLSIGTRVKFAAHDFSPGQKKIKSIRGNRYAATYKIKGGSRTTLLGGPFLATGKNSGKKLIIERKGPNKYPTTTVLLEVFEDTIRQVRSKLERYLSDTFKRELTNTLEAMDKE